LVLKSNPAWNDLYDTLVEESVDGRDKPGHDGE
jgi:hypothetical protein